MALYLYHGDETYRLNQAVQALREQYVVPEMAAFSHKILKKPAIHELLETLGAVSFNLGGDTLIEIQGFTYLEKAATDKTDKALLDELKTLLEGLPSSDPNKHVLFVVPKIDRKVKFPKWFSTFKGAQVRDFKKLNFWETDKAVQFLMGEAKSKSYPIQPKAAELLVNNMGVELQPLFNELEKLALFANGRPITEADVKQLSNHPENTFQMLSDWINRRRPADVFQTLDELLLRQHPVPLFALAQSHLNHIFQLHYLKRCGYSEADIADRLKKHPFKIKKDFEEYRHVPFERLEMLKEKILELEWQCKTGQLDSRLSFELLMGA